MSTPSIITNKQQLAEQLRAASKELNEDPEEVMLRLFRMQAPKAMLVITELMLDQTAAASVRLRAAEHILGRAIGPIKGKLTIKSVSDNLYDEIIDLEIDLEDQDPVKKTIGQTNKDIETQNGHKPKPSQNGHEVYDG